MNSRLYEATSDEFPDLIPAFNKSDNQFQSSYYAFEKYQAFLRKPMSNFQDVGKRVIFKCTSRTHLKE